MNSLVGGSTVRQLLNGLTGVTSGRKVGGVAREVEVTLLLSPMLLGRYRRDHRLGGSLWRSIAKRGGQLRQMHPEIDDERLSRYFALRLPADLDADPVLGRLRADPDVEAAYVAPAAELPTGPARDW